MQREIALTYNGYNMYLSFRSTSGSVKKTSNTSSLEDAGQVGQ